MELSYPHLPPPNPTHEGARVELRVEQLAATLALAKSCIMFSFNCQHGFPIIICAFLPLWLAAINDSIDQILIITTMPVQSGTIATELASSMYIIASWGMVCQYLENICWFQVMYRAVFPSRFSAILCYYLPAWLWFCNVNAVRFCNKQFVTARTNQHLSPVGFAVLALYVFVQLYAS